MNQENKKTGAYILKYIDVLKGIIPILSLFDLSLQKIKCRILHKRKENIYKIHLERI